MINEEPVHAKAPPMATYVNAKGEMVSPSCRIKGIICKDVLGLDGKVLYRANLTAFVTRDKGVFEQDGLVVAVNGQRYVLKRLVQENKNRIIGAIGFYVPEDKADSAPIQILEVEDLG